VPTHGERECPGDPGVRSRQRRADFLPDRGTQAAPDAHPGVAGGRHSGRVATGRGPARHAPGQ